jgi:hypothetical protein
MQGGFYEEEEEEKQPPENDLPDFENDTTTWVPATSAGGPSSEPGFPETPSRGEGPSIGLDPDPIPNLLMEVPTEGYSKITQIQRQKISTHIEPPDLPTNEGGLMCQKPITQTTNLGAPE